MAQNWNLPVRLDEMMGCPVTDLRVNAFLCSVPMRGVHDVMASPFVEG